MKHLFSISKGDHSYLPPGNNGAVPSAEAAGDLFRVDETTEFAETIVRKAIEQWVSWALDKAYA